MQVITDLTTYLQSVLDTDYSSLTYYDYDPTAGSFKKPFMAVVYQTDRKSAHIKTIGGTWRDYDLLLIMGVKETKTRGAADTTKVAIMETVRDALVPWGKVVSSNFIATNVVPQKPREPIDREKNLARVLVTLTDRPG